jgi:hypothetical protein
LKNVTGYDMHRMQLGVQGILGLPIGVSLRTEALPQHRYERYHIAMPSDNQTELLLHRLKNAPPQGLQHLDIVQEWDDDTHAYTLALDLGWQGDHALLDALFGEFTLTLKQNVPNRSHVDTPLDEALIPYQGMANDFPILMHALVPAAGFSLAFIRQLQAILKPKMLRYSSGEQGVWMGWEARQGHTLMRLAGQLGAMQSVGQLRNISVWKAPAGFSGFAQAAWEAQLNPTLWEQYATLRREWSIAPEHFHSPYVDASLYT